MLNKILSLFKGKKPRKPSLLAYHILDVTYGTWMEDLYRKNMLGNYKWELYSTF